MDDQVPPSAQDTYTHNTPTNSFTAIKTPRTKTHPHPPTYTINQPIDIIPPHTKPQKNAGGNYYTDMGTIDSTDKGWPTGESGWLKEVPWGFRKLLNWIKNVRDGGFWGGDG